MRELILCIDTQHRGRPPRDALLLVYLLWSSVSYGDNILTLLDKRTTVEEYLNHDLIRDTECSIDWCDVIRVYDHSVRQSRKRPRNH